MFNRYIIELYKAYCYSLVMPYDDKYILNDLSFIKWVEILYKNTLLYREYLLYLGLNISLDSTIELDKGKYDTLGRDVNVCSKYAYTLGIPNMNLHLINNKPIILDSKNIYDVSDYSIFITHNKLESNTLSNLIRLHNLGYKVVVGMYGLTNDKDMNLKIRVLESANIDDTEYSFDTINDRYFACIKSKDNIRIKKLVR